MQSLPQNCSQPQQPFGLSMAEAEARLQNDGPNELPSSKPRSVVVIAWQVIKKPIFLLLLACGAIYLFLGDCVPGRS